MSDDLEAQTFSDPEMGRLMGLINQLLEGQVVAMVVARGENLVLAIPKTDAATREAILERLGHADWDELAGRVGGAGS